MPEQPRNGRIPEEELQRLKNDTDLVALVRSKGVELKPHGRDLVGKCPFHKDDTPSLVVTPEKVPIPVDLTPYPNNYLTLLPFFLA